MSVVLKYNAPVNNALPSLSTLGSLDLFPKYLSSKASKVFAASVAELAAAVAEVAAAVAEVAAAVAFSEAVVALPAASSADV